jgi:hypothetical protein
MVRRLHDPPMTPSFKGQGGAAPISKDVFSSKLRGMKKMDVSRLNKQQKKDTYLMG